MPGNRWQMLLFVAQLYADTPVASWAHRGDAAAGDVQKAAVQLAETAEAIANSGRAARQAALESDAAELVRRARLFEAIVMQEPAPLDGPVPGEMPVPGDQFTLPKSRERPKP